jgi:hypothetical protein
MGADAMISALDYPTDETLSEGTYKFLYTGSWVTSQSRSTIQIVLSYRPAAFLTDLVIAFSVPTGFAAQEFDQELWGRPSPPIWDLPGYDASVWIERWWPWLSAFTESLEELRRLPENWDSYGASRIDKTALIGAIRLLIDNNFQGPAPYVIPTPHGGIQLEWQDTHGGVEIVIDRDGSLSILIDRDGDFEEQQTDSIRDPFVGAALARVQQR